MKKPIRRQACGSGFGPAHLRQTIDVPIALDNLICGVCGRPLGDVRWCVVSSPKRKGIVIFACEEHISPAMNLLSEIIPGLSSVPPNLKLPEPESN